jgi:hypothetical protein
MDGGLSSSECANYNPESWTILTKACASGARGQSLAKLESGCNWHLLWRS